MKHWHREGLSVSALVLALLWPAWAAAQNPPPLPERVRTLDESLKQEQDELLQRVAPGAHDQGRLVAALKAQQAAWLQYRDATCALVAGSGPSGTAATRTLQCKADWTEAQRMRLWTALDCIGQGDPADRAGELDRCLPPLAATYKP